MTALQCNEDLKFQERFWMIQRFAWGLGAGILALAIAGVTGSGGVFAVQSLGESFRFDRVARIETPTRLIFRPGASQPDVFLSQSYLDHVRLLRIQPPPNAVSADLSGIAWIYREVPKEVRIDVIPEDVGTLRGTAGLGEPFPFAQRVLP
jgi:hypothetical protein